MYNNQIANRIGSLVGNPLSGKYMDKLFVLKDTAQGVHGWISSQGDSISTVSAVDLINEFADGTNMVESIADLNGGYPVFAWQLLDKENRQQITDYLNTYFETEIKDYATKKQGEAITDILDAQADAIDNATSAQAVITAYQTSVTAMDKGTLLAEAKNDALAQITTLIESYKAKYGGLSSELDALKAEKNTAMQCKNGGWGLTADSSDIDMTAMALQSLAPYKDDEGVDPAIDKALNYLAEQQNEFGGFESYGTRNSESCAQVIVALCSLDVDPMKDKRFVKNGNTVVDALCTFAVDGGFCHQLEQPEADGIATEQAY